MFVTFPDVNQAAVQQFGWLAPGQMVIGLGLAESTPGQLTMVTEFVGILGAYRFPGSLDPVMAEVLGAIVTVWAPFAPCFLWGFNARVLSANSFLDDPPALSFLTRAVESCSSTSISVSAGRRRVRGPRR
jgi:hypothetical protein